MRLEEMKENHCHLLAAFLINLIFLKIFGVVPLSHFLNILILIF